MDCEEIRVDLRTVPHSADRQRSTQLLIPTFDYCIPTKQCPNSGVSGAESPCDVFGQIEFPMDAFFPSKNDACIPPSQSCTGCARTAE